MAARRPRPNRGWLGGVRLVRVGDVRADASRLFLEPVDEELRWRAANTPRAGWDIDAGSSCGRETEHVLVLLAAVG